MVVAYVGHASTVPPPVTLAVVSWLCELTRFEPIRELTRPCATPPDTAMAAHRPRTATVDVTRDLAIRSRSGCGIRPCLLWSFRRRSDGHGRYGPVARTVSGADRIFAVAARTQESVREKMRSKIRISRINICYDFVVDPTPVRFLQACPRSTWLRTCDRAVGCLLWMTTRSSATSSQARSRTMATPLAAPPTLARRSI